MDFSLTEEQLMIQQTASSFLASAATSSGIRKAMSTDNGFDGASWQRLQNEMGWLLTHVPECHDGLGLGFVELAILLEKMGEYLYGSPFYSTAVLGINSLLVAGNEPQKSQYLQRILAERQLCTLAFAGRGRHSGIESIEATYCQRGEDSIINGNYYQVVDGHIADFLIVAARDIDNADNIGLFIVEANSIQSQLSPTLDQTRKLAKVHLKDVVVSAENSLSLDGKQSLQQILALAAIGLAAEQMGIANKTLAMSVDYIAQRQQFGRAIGSFQAIKHKVADMMLKAESARSAVYYAACIADEFMIGSELGNQLIEASQIALSYCSDACFFNSGCAIQLHGGVGFTWEYDVHLYFKRAKASQHLLGDSDYHRQQLATMLLDDELRGAKCV